LESKIRNPQSAIRNPVIFLFIIALAAFLRFYLLDGQSFWNDEGNSARIAERSLQLITEGAAGQDSVAPQPTLPDTDEFDAACTAGRPAPLADPGLVVRLHGRAVVDGRPVEVWVVDTGGGSRLVAIDRTCTVVVDQAVG
jgi:hypothetical protein